MHKIVTRKYPRRGSDICRTKQRLSIAYFKYACEAKGNHETVSYQIESINKK